MSKPQQKQQVQELIDKSWMEKGRKIWIEQQTTKNEQSSFLQGILISYSDKEVLYELQDKSQQKKEIQFIYERADDYTDPNYKGYEDMINMDIINDPELLVNIEIRYKNNLIFTYVGPTLLVANPFKAVPHLVNQDIKFDYIGKIAIQGCNQKELPPHIYALGSEAYRNLFENMKNQAIVISGESGAGKTESAKLAMNLLTSIGNYLDQKKSQQIQAMDDVGIEEKILSCNPILESFGNAKTIRNNNSSRFGKYVQIMVNKQTQKIEGATIINYLLEKSRINYQGAEERGFHIFYFLINGMSIEKLEKYYLSEGGKKLPFSYFNYIKGDGMTYVVQKINDVQEYQILKDSIKLLGIKVQFPSIMKLISTVLFLGNVEFDESTLGNGENDTCTIVNPEIIDKIQNLLEIDKEDILKSLLKRRREMPDGKGFKESFSPLSRKDCIDIRDSWAKSLYEKLFNWLVQKLNLTIQPSGDLSSYVSIGLLDIYGFEVFEKNSFEQMMINFTNEKLHQLYISYVFKEEEGVFKAEGLEQYCGQIQFSDNQAVIDLLEKYPTGVFDLLDSSCQVASSNDDSLLAEIKKNPSKSQLLVNPKMSSKKTFIIIHTAKEVEYSIENFRDKNKDQLKDTVIMATVKSKDPLIASFFANEDKVGAKFLSKKIRAQMADLMRELNSCDVHFVRCIKPNDKGLKETVWQNFTLNQIRYLGVLDSLKVRKKNYPIRKLYQNIYKQYGDMTKNKSYPILIKENANFRDLTVQMFKDFIPQLGIDMVLFGTKKIFIKIEATQVIENRFKEVIAEKNKSAIKIQKSWKIYKLKKNIKKLSKRRRTIIAKIKKYRLKIYRKKCIKSAIKLQKFIKHKLQQWKQKKYRVQMLSLQTYIKRAIQVKEFILKKQQFIKIQRYFKYKLFRKKMQERLFRISLFNLAFDKAWLNIQNKASIIIQKYVRGYLFRKKNKKKVQQIKEAGRQYRIKKVILTIQKHARGYLVRSRLGQMHRAAFYIQGFIKMRWLSGLFHLMRAKVVVIQRQVRTFLAQQRAYKEKYEIYIRPMEEQRNEDQLREQQILFGSFKDTQIEDFNNNAIDTPETSPFQYYNQYPTFDFLPSDSPFLKKQLNETFSDDQSLSFDQIFDQDSCPIETQQKIKLFAFIIDIDLHCSIREYYQPSFSQHWKQIFQTTYEQNNSLQYVEVGATHAMSVNANGKLYCWGKNDFSQLGFKASTQSYQPIITKFNSYVKQISAGSDHSLILLEDGSLFISGSNLQGQQLDPISINRELRELSLPFKTSQVCTTNNTSFILSEEGKVYTWPTRKSLMPIEIQPQNTIIKCVTAGTQFACLLSDVGHLYTFGENQHGELGLGDNKPRITPTQITTLPKGIAVSQVSCGLKHTVIRSTNGRIFTWGLGTYGQLGNKSLKNSITPYYVDYGFAEKVIQVHASNKTTLLLLENKKILWSGTNGTISYQTDFKQFKIELKSTTLAQTHFTPVRITSSSSRTLNLIQVTFANHNRVLQHQPELLKRVLNQLTLKWADIQPQSANPPYIETISSYFSELHQKISKKSPKEKIKRNNGVRSLLNGVKKTSRFTHKNWKQNDSNSLQHRHTDDEFQPSYNDEYKNLKMEEDHNQIETDHRLLKLKLLKERVIRLKTTPEHLWTQDDQEFIEQIYQNSINQILDVQEIK